MRINTSISADESYLIGFLSKIKQLPSEAVSAGRGEHVPFRNV